MNKNMTINITAPGRKEKPRPTADDFKDPHKSIVEQATAAACDGVSSVVAHATRAIDGAATLTIKLTVEITGTKTVIETAWTAEHKDKDGDSLPPTLLDRDQMTLNIE